MFVSASIKKKSSKESSVVWGLVMQGLSTLLSRISGLTRDVVTAHFLGAGHMSDAFFASFRIPNSIRKLIGEGPLSVTFVPIYIEEMIKDKENAKRFAGAVFVLVGIITIACIVALLVFMPQFLGLIVPGLKKTPNVFDMAVMMSRISVPFMFLTCSVAVFGGITNASKVFFPFGITPLILNFCMTICLVMLGKVFNNRGVALSIGVVVGGVVQLVFMFWAAIRYDIFPNISFNAKDWEKVSGLIRLFFIRLTPILFGQGIFQVNMFVDGIFASYSLKTQSYLYYSDRLSQFAITIIGHTLGTVSLPTIAAYISQKNMQKARMVQGNCIFWAIVWSVPAAACLFILAHPMVQMIYMRGQFLKEDAFHVGNMLKIICLVIPAMSVNRVLYSSIYAIQKVRAPVIIGIIAVTTNILANLLLIGKIEHYYVSISTAISACVEFLLIGSILGLKYRFLHVDKKILISIPKIVASTAITCYCCTLIYGYFTLKIGILGGIVITTPACIAIYSVILVAFRVFSLEELYGLLGRVGWKIKNGV